MAKLKVLLIEDNRFLRDGTTAMLNKQVGIKAVSTCGNKSALEKARKLGPNVVLLDVGPRKDSTLKVLEAIQRQHPRAEVLVMDLIPAHTDVAKNVLAGVSGVVSRNEALDNILRRIRSVGSKPKGLSPTSVNSLLFQIVGRANDGKSEGRMTVSAKFTKREQDIICLLAQGKSIESISRGHKVSVSIVKSYIRNILDKLALHVLRELTSFDQVKFAS